MSARSPSLILRATLGFALVALLAVGGAGLFLYHSLERTVLERADYALLGRLAHFRSLLSADLSLETLGRSPQLFANMLGNEQDVFLIGAPAAKPVIAPACPDAGPVCLVPTAQTMARQGAEPDDPSREPARTRPEPFRTGLHRNVSCSPASTRFGGRPDCPACKTTQALPRSRGHRRL